MCSLPATAAVDSGVLIERTRHPWWEFPSGEAAEQSRAQCLQEVMISAYLSSSRAYPWPVAKLERRHYVALAGRSQQGNLPGLILQCAGKAKTRFQEEVSVHGYVVLSSALREILSVNVAMAKLDADFGLRTQPGVASYCFTLRGPAYPGTDELAVIGVSVQVLPVTVIAAIACGEVHRTCRTALCC